MEYKTVLIGPHHRQPKTPLEMVALTGYMSERSLLHMVALVSRLFREGIQGSSVVRALTSFYPHYALLIQQTLQALEENPLLATDEVQRARHTTHDVDLHEVCSQDGEWMWRYEYPRRAEPVHSGGSGFTVYAAPQTSYTLVLEEKVVRCVESTETVLLRITGDCQTVTSIRGSVTPFGRSLDSSHGFFLAALKEGEAICVTNHRNTYSRVYLFVDGIVNELSLTQWTSHFELSLAPLE
jgi:hypothetical protein